MAYVANEQFEYKYISCFRHRHDEWRDGTSQGTSIRKIMDHAHSIEELFSKIGSD